MKGSESGASESEVICKLVEVIERDGIRLGHLEKLAKLSRYILFLREGFFICD